MRLGLLPEAAAGIAQIRRRTADRELAETQKRAVAIAQGEIDAGVSEAKTPARIAQYADYKHAAMNYEKGDRWCAYFADFAQTEAARKEGKEFAGRTVLHSDRKAYEFFTYSMRRDRDLKAKHEAAGQTRQLFRLEGSPKPADWPKSDGQVFSRYQDLPIRPGDTIVFSFGHVGMVKSYDPKTGQLETVEGNRWPHGRSVSGNFHYDLSKPGSPKEQDGWNSIVAFGRPAPSDFAK